MPLFDYECPECLEYTEDVLMGHSDPDPECEVCGASMVRQFRPATLIGITPSKPVVSKQLGKVFESNKEYKDYLSSRGLTDCGVGDSRIRKMKDDSRNAADATARRMGYRDHEDRARSRPARDKERAEKAKKAREVK